MGTGPPSPGAHLSGRMEPVSPLKPYADQSSRRTLQIVVDVAAVVAITLLVLVGVSVYTVIAALGAVGADLAATGADFQQSMIDVAESVSGVPLLGPGIGGAFAGAGDAGGLLQQTGQGIETTVTVVALTAALAAAGLPILVILLVWLVPRVRFARRAGRAAAMVREGVSLDLLALRAMARMPLAELLEITADPVAAWREGDPVVTYRLAARELERDGVRLGAVRA